MRPDEFQPNTPGEVVRSVQGHWTYHPSPLPPDLSIDLPLMRQLSEADLALGELAGVGRRLPNPLLLIRPFIRREAVLSSKIEGTVTQLDQLFLFEAEPDNVAHPSDAGEVRNYVRATEYGLTAIRDGYPFSLGLVCEVHRCLLADVRGADKRPGELRNRGVLIGREGQGYDAARFVPACHTQLRPLLDDFITFLRDHRDLPIVVQLALMHYQFETIHPFNDGNGRVGRLLITLMLCERKVLPEPLLYLSAYFERHRDEYYDGLLNVSRRGAWNEWIGFFARGVVEQARDAAERATRLLDLAVGLRERAARAINSAQVHGLVDELLASPFLTASRAAVVTGLAFKNAQRMVNKFVDAGLLRETTGRKTHRIYCADAVLRLLDAPLSELPPATANG